MIAPSARSGVHPALTLSRGKSFSRRLFRRPCLTDFSSAPLEPPYGHPRGRHGRRRFPPYRKGHSLVTATRQEPAPPPRVRPADADIPVSGLVDLADGHGFV